MIMPQNVTYKSTFIDMKKIVHETLHVVSFVFIELFIFYCQHLIITEKNK